jgi:hypothetical protein
MKKYKGEITNWVSKNMTRINNSGALSTRVFVLCCICLHFIVHSEIKKCFQNGDVRLKARLHRRFFLRF